MSKFAHWCDKDHQKKESQFDTYVLAQKLVNTLTDWVLTDFTLYDGMTDYQVQLQRARMRSILSIAEEIECLIIDANSIYAIYETDYIERRQRWMKARGLCFQLTAKLSHIVNYVESSTNVDKYIRLEDDIKLLASKIKKVIIADDEKKKKYVKPYT